MSIAQTPDKAGGNVNDDLLMRVSAKVFAWAETVGQRSQADSALLLSRFATTDGKPLLSPYPGTCNGGLLAILREVADPNAYVRRDVRGCLGADWVVRLDRGPAWLGTSLIYGATEFEALLVALDRVLP